MNVTDERAGDLLARLRAGVYPVPDPRSGDQVMAAVVPAAGAVPDPSGFAPALAAQSDLDTKWTPRFVRVTADLPLTATGKVDRAALRRAGGEAGGDTVWWLREPAGPYAVLTDADRADLAARFATHARTHLLDLDRVGARAG